MFSTFYILGLKRNVISGGNFPLGRAEESLGRFWLLAAEMTVSLKKFPSVPGRVPCGAPGGRGRAAS